jgi:hypothetical protein
VDYSLHLLTKSHVDDDYVFPFGGGLSGHHGKVNDIAFCGGRSEESARYVATVSGKTIYLISTLHVLILDDLQTVRAKSPT